MDVPRGCSTSSMTLVGNSSKAGVEARVISGSIISCSMETEGSNSSSLYRNILMDNSSKAGVEARGISGSIISGGMETEGSNSLSLSSSTLMDNSSNAGVRGQAISSSRSSNSTSGVGPMLLRSGALVRLVSPIACGISLSPLRL